MFAEVHHPEHLPANQLDAYLERGWFRMGQTIFTTNFAHVNDTMLSTLWLRIQLSNYTGDAQQQKIFKRAASFVTTIQPATCNAEKEELYARYRQSLPFAVSESVHHLLFGKGDGTSIYTTYEVTVRAGDQLIACGFFDLGESSAAGITSFYDPTYKKYSLGKYLIYKKVEYCKNQGKQYFYPGYFVPGNSHFDYKLSIGHNALQFFALHANQWLSISEFERDLIPVHAMQAQLQRVQQVLTAANINCKLFKYEFFDANLIPDLRNVGLFDFPVFLAVTETNNDLVNPVLVYDVRTGQYYSWMCAPVWKPDGINPDPSFYSNYFIKPIQELYASADAEKVAAVWMKFFKPVDVGIRSESRI